MLPASRVPPARPGSTRRSGWSPSTTPDPGQPVAVGVEGQIIAALDGDEAFDGYWKRPDADAGAPA